MKVTTKLNVKGFKAWCVLLDGQVKFDNLTIHQASQIANELRLELKQQAK